MPPRQHTASEFYQDVAFFEAAQSIRRTWPTRPPAAGVMDRLLTGTWAEQIAASTELRDLVVSRALKDLSLVLLVVPAVRALRGPEFRRVVRTMADLAQAVGYAPALEALWSQATPGQRATLTDEDVVALTQAPAGDIRLWAITIVVPGMAEVRAAATLPARLTAWRHSVARRVQRTVTRQARS